MEVQKVAAVYQFCGTPPGGRRLLLATSKISVHSPVLMNALPLFSKHGNSEVLFLGPLSPRSHTLRHLRGTSMSGHRQQCKQKAALNAVTQRCDRLTYWVLSQSASGPTSSCQHQALLSLPVYSIHYQLNDQKHWQAPVSKRPRSKCPVGN